MPVDSSSIISSNSNSTVFSNLPFPLDSFSPITVFLAISAQQKQYILQKVLSHDLSICSLRRLAVHHTGIKLCVNSSYIPKKNLHIALLNHIYTDLCLISLADAYSVQIQGPIQVLASEAVAVSQAELKKITPFFYYYL
jgi:hypothetical protein